MKKKLNLTKLNKNELADLKAGVASVTISDLTVLCVCGCYYEDCGGSSEYDNATANMRGGLSSDPNSSCD
jgi:hypothetical protein